MLTGIEIRNFRGIERGTLEGLAPLSVLTGTNASGKTSLMDALLVGACPDPEAAILRATQRHSGAATGAQWLVHGGPGSDARCSVVVGYDNRDPLARTLWGKHPSDVDLQYVALPEVPPPYYAIHCSQNVGREPQESMGEPYVSLLFGGDGSFTRRSLVEGPGYGDPVVLVDPQHKRPLTQAYSDAKRAGRGQVVLELARSLGLRGLELLTEPDSEKPSLYVDLGNRVVPLALAGDGIQSVVQTALELARAVGGLVLLEEPEAFQHPSTLSLSARVIVEAVRRGIQVVVSTHSQELIDKLLLANTREQADQVAQFTLSLKDGELSAVRRAGDELYEERWERERDLR